MRAEIIQITANHFEAITSTGDSCTSGQDAAYGICVSTGYAGSVRVTFPVALLDRYAGLFARPMPIRIIP